MLPSPIIGPDASGDNDDLSMAPATDSGANAIAPTVHGGTERDFMPPSPIVGPDASGDNDDISLAPATNSGVNATAQQLPPAVHGDAADDDIIISMPTAADSDNARGRSLVSTQRGQSPDDDESSEVTAGAKSKNARRRARRNLLKPHRKPYDKPVYLHSEQKDPSAQREKVSLSPHTDFRLLIKYFPGESGCVEGCKAPCCYRPKGYAGYTCGTSLSEWSFLGPHAALQSSKRGRQLGICSLGTRGQ
jgi:hypothetical protein